MMFEKELHIISFNVPYPADYGGVIDVFYKIRALAEAGAKITLHTYKYGREEAPELEKYCVKVHYYQRHIFKDPFFSKLPYIVATRNSSQLLANLLKDNNPIVFEGVHCCYYLAHPALRHRMKIVRMHNIEHVYYKNLSKIEKNIFKKFFFNVEADRLKAFGKTLSHANSIAAISPDDEHTLRLKYDKVFYLPPFHSNDAVNIQTRQSDFALYHGNLGVGENNEAALFLVNEVFDNLDYKFVIAGNNPSPELKKAVENKPNILLRSKISTTEIFELIRDARINVLPTFQSTGMKLKLINVLFQGHHCIVNHKMVKNTGLEPLCILANTASEMKRAILSLERANFTHEDIEERKKYLENEFSNQRNAVILLEQMGAYSLIKA